MSEHLDPGKKCPTCERRVPFPKKESSPVSVPVSYRVPVDERDVHLDTLKALAERMGTFGRPHWQWSTINWAVVSAFKDPETDGVASRNNWFG